MFMNVLPAQYLGDFEPFGVLNFVLLPLNYFTFVCGGKKYDDVDIGAVVRLNHKP